MSDLVQESAVLGSKFSLFATCVRLLYLWLTTHLDRKVFLCRSMDWVFGQTIHGWLQSTFFMAWFPVFASFRPFLNKKCQTYGDGMVLWKKNWMPYLDSSYSNTPIDISFFPLCEKRFKTPHSHSFWSFDLNTLSWSSWGIYIIDVTPFLDIYS